MAVWNECEGWKRSGYYQIRYFADRNRSQDVANSHCICRIDRAGIERLFRSKPHSDAA